MNVSIAHLSKLVKYTATMIIASLGCRPSSRAYTLHADCGLEGKSQGRPGCKRHMTWRCGTLHVHVLDLVQQIWCVAFPPVSEIRGSTDAAFWLSRTL